MDKIDCVVIGAGVVGLAIARELARQGRETVILEQEMLFGAGTSSRNSEVIHAGIYYPQGSLKARLCVEGRDRLYAYCASHGVEHRRRGKLIVACSEAQIPALQAIEQAGKRNSVEDLRWLSGAEAMALEPNLRCTAALISPSTGIVDSHGYMLALLGDAEAAGAAIAYGTRASRLKITGDTVQIAVNDEAEPSLSARLLVNAAGLQAEEVARSIEGFPAAHIPRSWLARGCYFTLSGRAPFSRLIYPIPEPGGLGTHVTVDLGGQAKFGPDVEWIDRIDYTVDPSRADTFYAAIRSYWPGLKDGQLAPGYSGIRPKLSGPGMPAVDFHIGGKAVHGVRPVINLFGIESPGLTSSLAIAAMAGGLAADVLDA